MNIECLKDIIKSSIKKLEDYEKKDSPLSSYEIGRLNAYDEILCFIELLEDMA